MVKTLNHLALLHIVVPVEYRVMLTMAIDDISVLFVVELELKNLLSKLQHRLVMLLKLDMEIFAGYVLTIRIVNIKLNIIVVINF